MHPARAAVDGHIQIALAALAIGGLQLGQVLDVHMHKAKIVVLKRAALAFALMSGPQTPQVFRLEDAVNRVPVEMGQKVADHEGEVIEQKTGGLAQGADDRPLFVRGFPGQLMAPAGMVQAVIGPALALFADGLGAHAEAFGQNARGLRRAGNLAPNGRGGSGLRVDGQHHVLLR
jgi:hypothetical protein